MITINLDKAKAIGHDKRRAARAEEFKPYDEVIMKQIPGADNAAAEEARQQIRFKYATGTRSNKCWKTRARPTPTSTNVQ
jgi:hypothetical protein